MSLTADASTASLPAPAAARLRRPSWRDPRLVVGVLLVLTSVALGARVVAAADDTVPVWAARSTLAVGTPVTPDVLVVVRARLEGGARYLDGAGDPPPGLVVLRAVGAGELVPASAVGPAASLGRRPVVVPVRPPLAEGLRPGARVDVWVSRPDPRAADASVLPAQRVVQGADVRAVTQGNGSLAVSGEAGVEILLEAASLPVVLDALAARATVSLVPLPGTPAAQVDR